MTKFILFGAAAVISTVFVGPAMARHAVPSRVQQNESTYCATIEPGNPYSPAYDYQGWSNWRLKGGWDSRGDDACARNPLFNGSSF
jgi:hypothetical protein